MIIQSIKALYTKRRLPAPFSFWTFIGGFGAFLGSFMLLIPFMHESIKDYPRLNHLNHVIPRELMGLLFVSIIFPLYLYTQRKSLMPYFKNPGFIAGILSWFFITPLVMAWSSLIEYIMKTLLGYPMEEQAAVLIVKNISHDSWWFYVLLLYVGLIVPIIEEIVFRGFLQNWLRNYLSPVLYIVITSIIFAFFHYSVKQGAANVPILSALFFLSCFLGWLVDRTGSLRTSIGLHATFNTLTLFFILLKEKM